MSRIGRAPIAIPAGVTIEVKNNIMTVKGPKGELNQDIDSRISVKIENNVALVERHSEDKNVRAKHGLYRALLNNMVTGVTKGFEKSLILNGVGYKVSKQGEKIVMNIGYSHPVEILPIKGITIDCPTITEIVVKGINKVDVGQTAASIRAKRMPEPYHGYGIRYKDEVIERKEGKTAGK